MVYTVCLSESVTLFGVSSNGEITDSRIIVKDVSMLRFYRDKQTRNNLPQYPTVRCQFRSKQICVVLTHSYNIAIPYLFCKLL